MGPRISSVARVRRRQGDRLYRARLAAKLTRQELADIIGVTVGSIGHYECGRTTPLLPKQIAIAKALGSNPFVLDEEDAA